MTEQQKAICQSLLDASYDTGFCYYPLSLLAEKHHLPEKELYDWDTQTGILWEFDFRANQTMKQRCPYAGYLDFTSDGYVMIQRDILRDFEHDCDY